MEMTANCDDVKRKREAEVCITIDYDSSEDDAPISSLLKKQKSACDYQRDLREKGYAIIEDVLTPEEVAIAKRDFYAWADSSAQFKSIHSKVSPHGIIKHFEIGHQRHAWFIRTRSKVQDPFKKLWKTDKLTVSYDGTCWIPANNETMSKKKRDGIWTHTDQAPSKNGLTCYQGFVALTDNVERSLVVYEGSHLLHRKYCDERKDVVIPKKDWNKDWLLIDHDYLEKIADSKRVLNVKAGSLVLWDSRTFHQNQYGNLPDEERIVQYVSYLPKRGCKEGSKMREKRQKYFEERRTTSHWAYPVKVNGLQPQNYGNKDWVIDYSALRKPELGDLMPEIVKLI
jgi:ectoine hydroxylase-related dioxygenase (phytanoyl-CoA dioxygenase family)